MRNIFSLIVIFTFICCDSSGIEGFLNEPITISANNPEEGQDFDYLWTLANQPDGSLINSSDLITSDDGQEMVFTPDYPGNYSIEVVISKYGDNVSNQTFSFKILDQKIDMDLEEKNSETSNEDWLEEEIDDYIEESDEDYGEESDEKNKFLISNQKTKVSANIEILNKGLSIAAKTDRFTIQITSKRMLKDAQLFSQKLIKRGYDSYIQKVIFKSNEIWYRVRVGSYDNYNTAKNAANALSKDLNMATWVDFVRKEQ